MEGSAKEIVKAAIEEMRADFARGDWHATVAAYDRIRRLFKKQGGPRLEATCLAVRSLIGLKEREKARALLKSVSKHEYAKAVHYEMLAWVFLDLRKFDDAARACTSAHVLRQSEVRQ